MVLFVLIAELSLKDTEELTHPVRDAVPVQMTTQEREMGEKNAHTKLLSVWFSDEHQHWKAMHDLVS